MPKVRRRPKARRELDWTASERDQLLCGHDFGFGFGFGRVELDEFDEATARVAWSELRAELLPAWIYERPGSRPWAWWRFDSPEPRRRVDGHPHPFTDPERAAKVAELRRESPAAAGAALALWFGTPCVITASELSHPPEYESEAEYLARLNLLTPSEIGVTMNV